jgi:hypothetical protein
MESHIKRRAPKKKPPKDMSHAFYGERKQNSFKKIINLKVKSQNQIKLFMDENHLLIEYDIVSSMKVIDIN